MRGLYKIYDVSFLRCRAVTYENVHILNTCLCNNMLYYTGNIRIDQGYGFFMLRF